MGKRYLVLTALTAFFWGVTGCGTNVPAQKTALPVTSASTVKAATASRSPAKGANTVRTKYAWVRIRTSTSISYPGDRVRLYLDFLSTDKPVDYYEARWSVSPGRLDRWFTRSPFGDNVFTAPDHSASCWLDVDLDINYVDGTSERVWLQETLRVR